jgi:hypothetical protein
MVMPPSTTIVCPVTEDAPGDLVGTAEPAQRHGRRQLASAFDAHPLVPLTALTNKCLLSDQTSG